MDSSNNKNYKNLNEIEKKDELKEKLKELLPSCFEDNIFNIEKFKQLLGEENNLDQNEKYGLNWVGKSKSFKESTKDSNMTLVPLRNKSVNFDESDNIIIEGDNLEVLKLLEKYYFNKIDVIYIDPPYNTGNDFFLYNDDYSQSKSEFDKENNLINEEGDRLQTKNQKSDGRIHTKWLSMIHPRLILAKKLLKDDGVIFISIDDNEQARLKLLCDEIFGENNFLSNLIWKARRGGGNDVKHIAIDHENILVYSKNKINCNLIGKPKSEDDFKFKDEYYKERGKYNLQQFDWASLTYTKSLDYPIQTPDGNFIYPGSVNKEEWEKRRSNIQPRNDWRWMMSEETYLNAKKDDFIVFEKDKNKKWKVKVKTYQNITYKGKNIDRYYKLRSVLENDFGLTRDGNNDVDILRLKNYFSYPKPVLLIKNLMKYIPKKEILILDFFAGSGTTAQAVMELNKEDGGNRKYILVQFPEESENLKDTEFETIADITRERVKRAIDMFQYKEKGYKAFKLVKSNLKLFDVSTSDLVDVIQSKFLDFENKIKENTSVENLIYEIILRVGELPLNTKIESEILYNNKV